MSTVRAARPTTLVEFTSPPPKPLASEADYNTPTLAFDDYPEFAEVPEGEASDFEEDLQEEEEEEDDEEGEVEEEEDGHEETEQQQAAESTARAAAKDDSLGPRRSIRKRSSPARLKPTVTNMGADSEAIRDIARAAGAKDGQVLAKALERAIADGRTEATDADLEKARKEVALEARMSA